MFLSKKKKTQTAEPNLYGFSFAPQPLTKCANRTLSCALKGLFIFAAVYGTLGGLISSFQLPCYPVAIMVILLILSVALAFLHYNRIVFNIFYPLTFLLFTFAIFTYRYHVYSGFQAFLNILQEKYSTYFDLSLLREANEYFSDRNMTITIAAVFIGFFLIVLLNIAVSEYMNLPLTILLTFPIFQLGIYIEEMPDFPYLVLLLFSYFMIAILKRSEHFLLPYREKENPDFTFKKIRQQQIWSYHASGRMMLQLTGLFFTFSLFLGIVCLPFLSTSTTGSASDLRKKTDEYVQIFTQNGLAGFFNRYEASGGLSEGRLGGVSSVRPDYETDLELTFVPFSYETLYLKAFTGHQYTGSEWTAPSYTLGTLLDELGTEKYTAYETYTSFLEARRLQHYMDEHPDHGIKGKIQVKNLDAHPGYLYLPYYTGEALTAPSPYSLERGVVKTLFPTDSTYSAEYYPLLHDYWPINAQPDEMLADLDPASDEARYIALYDTINTSSYIDMPQETREGLEDIKEEIGTAANIDAQIAAIEEYLRTNYRYSMMPGTTPRNADFALHFLNEQDSGYCAHFATAGALLLRAYGIPARYVEGYAIPFRALSEATAVDEPYEEWFFGENPIGETGVVTVNITDANAHAWVEVYKIGIGWVPYEFTPPDTGTPETGTLYSDFWGIFSGIFGGSPPPEEVANPTQIQGKDSFFDRAFGNSSFLAKPLLLFVGMLLALSFVFFAGRCLLKQLRMVLAYRRNDYVPLLSHHYRRLCRKLHRKQLLTKEFLLPSELQTLSVSSNYDSETIGNRMALLEKCCYSQHKITKNEADDLLCFLKKYIKSVK